MAWGDVLDRLHHLREERAVFGLARCERDAAVAEHDRRDAVPTRRRPDRIPRELRVEVGVDVDEPRGDQATVGIDLAAATLVDGPDRSDAVTVDRDVCRDGFATHSVDHQAIANDQVMRHGRGS